MAVYIVDKNFQLDLPIHSLIFKNNQKLTASWSWFASSWTTLEACLVTLAILIALVGAGASLVIRLIIKLLCKFKSREIRVKSKDRHVLEYLHK